MKRTKTLISQFFPFCICRQNTAESNLFSVISSCKCVITEKLLLQSQLQNCYKISRENMKRARSYDVNWVLLPAYRISHRGCLHDTGATFAPRRVHSGSLSWLYICLHDTTTKSHAGASRPGVSSLRLSHRGENFTPVRNLATVSCKHETTTRFGVKSV